MKRESFIFYKSFYDSIKELDPKDQVQIYDAIFQYQFIGVEKELNGIPKSIFTLIIPQLEANNKRYLNGCKGGAPKGNQKTTKKQPKNNQKTSEKQPNENVNDNVNVNDNDIKKENIKRKKFIKPTIEEVKAYCKERNNGVDYERFIDFYESKGWKVGNNPMKDWKACVRTWEKRNQKQEQLPKWFDTYNNNEEEELTDEERRFIEAVERGN